MNSDEEEGPDLITRNDNGKPTAVRYDAVNAKQIEALTATVQKVSNELEVNRRAQLVANER